MTVTDTTGTSRRYDIYDPDLYVFPRGTSTAIRDYEFGNSSTNSSGGDQLAKDGLAWEPGGGRLFAISSNFDGEYTLRIFDEPRKSQPTLTLTGPQSSARARAITVSGTLQSSTALPAGTPVTVRLRTARGDVSSVTAFTWDESSRRAASFGMKPVRGKGNHELWEVVLPAPPGVAVQRYRFVVRSGLDLVFYEDDPPLAGHEPDGGRHDRCPDPPGRAGGSRR